MPESVTFAGRSAASPAMGSAYGGRPAGPNVRSMAPPSGPSGRERGSAAPPTLTLPSPCLVVLVGPAASGKSTWAAEWFPAHQVVSSDALRALVGDGEHDLGASKDAFALLETVVQQRLRRHITTVEGLVEDGQLHPLQDCFADLGAAQCGYCTPGILVVAKALLDQDPHPSRERICEALSGNLCRCTGYLQIVEAVEAAAAGRAGAMEPRR